MLTPAKTLFAAILLSTLTIAGSTAAFVDSAAAQADQDHNAHHPGPVTATPPADTPMGMRGRGDESGMRNGDMNQMMSMMRDMTTMMSARSGMMESHVEGRIAALKTELKITEAQAPLWARFVDAMRAAGKSMNGAYHAMMQPDGTAALPTRLETQETMLANHLASLKAMKETLDPLYSSLSDEQKKVANGLMIGPMGMM
jgi:hypothetical protein